jgi:putative transcriptional regulator
MPMTSLQGHLLVASPKLLDPNFYRTIVLMVQHDDDGAMGLVLNRPLETSVKTAWEQVSEVECDTEGSLYHGGPCNGPLMVMHTNPAFSDAQIMPGVFFATERSSLEQLVSLNHAPMKFFVGYAGWGPGQLEGEIEEGAWVSAKADADSVFDGDAEQWHVVMKAIARATPLPGVNPKTIPEDPSMN